MAEQQLERGHVDSLIPRPHSPGKRLLRASSPGEKKSSPFSVLVTRFRVFVFPHAPQDEPLPVASQGFSLSRLRSRNKEHTTKQRVSTSLLPPPTVATAPAVAQRPAATTVKNEGTQSHDAAQVANGHAVGYATAQEDPESLNCTRGYEKYQDFFVASKVEVGEQLHREWETKVSPNLMRDRSTFGMSLGLKTDEINGREELCMAGPRPSPTGMKPTLIVTFRNESFKRKFGQEIQRYDYVKKLGVEIKMVLEDNGETTRRKNILPRWAASSPPNTSHADTNLPLRLIACEEEHVFGNGFACGLRLKFVMDCGGSRMTRHATLGGLIRIGDSVYGLTTGHTLVISGTENTGSEQIRGQLAFQDSDDIAFSDPLSWQQVNCHPTFVFAGQRFRTSDLRSSVSDDKYMSSDWLLVNMDDSGPTENTYEDPSGSRMTISETLALAQLNSGPVLVLSGWRRAQCGYLTQNSSILHTGRSAFRVRQIVMDEPMGLGSSGSWVVRGSQLCGYIVAIQEGSPKAYMLPIDELFGEIAALTGRQPVQLVSKDQFHSPTRPTVLSRVGADTSPAPRINNVPTPQRLPAQVAITSLPPTVEPFPATRSTFRTGSTSIRARLPKLTNISKPKRRRSRTRAPSSLEHLTERLRWFALSESSLLWSILAILFPGVYKTASKDKDGFRSSLRLLRLAERSAYVLFYFCLVEIAVLIIMGLGPAVIASVYLVSFSYNPRLHTDSSIHGNSTFLTDVANLTRSADLEVRVGYFSLCFRNATGPSICVGPYGSPLNLEEDPLGLVSMGSKYGQTPGLSVLFLAAGSFSILATILLFVQFVRPVRKYHRNCVSGHMWDGFMEWSNEAMDDRLRSILPSPSWTVFRNPRSSRKTLTNGIFLPIIHYWIINAAAISQLVALLCLIVAILWPSLSALGATVSLQALSGAVVKVQLGSLATGLGWLAIILGSIFLWGLRSTYGAVELHMASYKKREETYELRERNVIERDDLDLDEPFRPRLSIFPEDRWDGLDS